jgi:hypothetical protein
MAAPTLTVDGFDLSSYILWPDREDVNVSLGGSFQPQFGGNTAFNEGQPWVRDSAGNREMGFPLLLEAADTDALHALGRTIKSHLFQGAQVAFKPAGATNTSYFELERGTLTEHWDFYYDNATRLRAALKLSVRPYASTGTMAIVATAAGTGALQMAIPSVTLGDVAAPAVVRVFMGSAGVPPAVASGHVVAWGFTRSGAYRGVIPPASGLFEASVDGVATVLGEGTAIASQYIAYASHSLTENQPKPVVAATLTNTDMPGRHRVFAVWRHGMSPATSITLQAAIDGILSDPLLAKNKTPTYVASFKSASQWQLTDLGEINVPGVPTGATAEPFQLSLLIGCASGVSTHLASPMYSVNALMLLPADDSVAVQVIGSWGNGNQTHLSFDSRSQFPPVYAGRATTAYYEQAHAPPNLLDGLRGGDPKIPVGAASGPPQLIAFNGHPLDFKGSRPFAVRVEARQTFSFLR